jgi:hypothetical protein
VGGIAVVIVSPPLHTGGTEGLVVLALEPDQVHQIVLGAGLPASGEIFTRSFGS